MSGNENGVYVLYREVSTTLTQPDLMLGYCRDDCAGPHGWNLSTLRSKGADYGYRALGLAPTPSAGWLFGSFYYQQGLWTHEFQLLPGAAWSVHPALPPP